MTHKDLSEALRLAMKALKEAEAILGGEYGDHYGPLCEMMIKLHNKADELLARYDSAPPLPSEIEALHIRLETIERCLKHWIEWDTAQRAKEGLETTPDTHFYGPPTWPTHGMLQNWVTLMQQARSYIDGEAGRIAEAVRKATEGGV